MKHQLLNNVVKNKLVKNKLVIASITGLLSQGCLAEGSPWLAQPGLTSISLTQVYQSSDEIKKLPVKVKLSQNTSWLSINHGLSDDLAIDFKTGYAESREESGLTDTNLGLSWRLADEFIEDSLPTTTLRAGIIIDGDYDTGSPHAIGDGANGVEVSLLAGKVLQSWMAVSAELGYRKRTSGVPDDIFYSAGIHFLPTDSLSTSLSYRYTDARDGLSVGGPGFDGTNFNRLEEDVELLDFNISYSFNPALSLGLNAARVADGKNTANNEVFAATLGYSF